MRCAGKFRAMLLTLSGALALGGCASFTYVDRQNVRHVVGLVDVAVDDRAGSRMVAATTFGLAVTGATADGGGVAIGYSRNVFLALGRDACVDLKAAGPCAELAAAGDLKSGEQP